MYFYAGSSTKICDMLIKSKFGIKFDTQKFFTAIIFYFEVVYIFKLAF